eukprot:6203822-Pleurochrysis_carterae.AAC.2
MAAAARELPFPLAAPQVRLAPAPAPAPLPVTVGTSTNNQFSARPDGSDSRQNPVKNQIILCTPNKACVVQLGVPKHLIGPRGIESGARSVREIGCYWLSFWDTPVAINRLLSVPRHQSNGAAYRLAAVRTRGVGIDSSSTELQSTTERSLVGGGCAGARRLVCTTHATSWCTLRARFTAPRAALRSPCSLSLTRTG